MPIRLSLLLAVLLLPALASAQPTAPKSSPATDTSVPVALQSGPRVDLHTNLGDIVVELDEACRRQQLGEGWFKSLEEVPRRAISMTVRQILKAKQILCIVPDARKASAVAECFQGEISPEAPASILRTHSNTTVYLDKDSAALLRPEIVKS